MLNYMSICHNDNVMFNSTWVVSILTHCPFKTCMAQNVMQLPNLITCNSNKTIVIDFYKTNILTGCWLDFGHFR